MWTTRVQDAGSSLEFPRKPCQGQGKSKVDTTEICNDLAEFQREASSVTECRLLLLLRKFPVLCRFLVVRASTNSPVL